MKLTFDQRAFCEYGLHVALAVEERSGIRTGRPRRNRHGQLAASLELGGAVRTLAVLDFVDGQPIESFDEQLAGAAGLLLARVHRALSADAPMVSFSVVDWWEGRATREPRLAESLSALRVAVPDLNALVHGVLYSDPSPELLMQPDGVLALIDWGTPTVGPLLFDVASWYRHIANHSRDASKESVTQAFLAAYASSGVQTSLDLTALDHIVTLLASG